MTVLVFDLDDTLYDELTYVKSGFQEVSKYLSQLHGFYEDEIFQKMWSILEEQGRGKVFDQLLHLLGIYRKSLVRKCLTIYRLHKPSITLDVEAEECLQRFAHYPKYIVTDGNKIVQHSKLAALGLYERMKHCYVTHRYGKAHAKPSPYCFIKIAQREQVHPSHVIYIADNPRKDFVGIKPLGFKTIRVRQGQHKDIVFPVEYEADITIGSLAEIDDSLVARIIAMPT